MTESPEVRRLAREIVSIKRALANMERSPQMGFVSLDDASMNTYDQAGGLKAVYGRQHDGTFTAAVLDGPPPPVPAGLSAEGGPGEVAVSWDGTYEDDKRAPMDFHVVEVYAAEQDFTDRTEARLLGHFANEAGGEVTGMLPVGEWHVALVSKAQSGRRSAVSERVTVEVESVVDQELIDELNEKLDGMPSITWDSAAPTPADGDGKPEGAVWRRVVGGAIVGEWEWTGTAWEARPIADDAIASVDVGKLTASTAEIAEAVIAKLWVDLFTANKVTAAEIDVQDLWADSAFLGELNSATIIGAVIKTAATGMRVELDSANGIRIYNAAGEVVLHADADGNLALGDGPSNVVLSPAGITLETTRPFLESSFAVTDSVGALAVGGGSVYASIGFDHVAREYSPTGELGRTFGSGEDTSLAFRTGSLYRGGAYGIRRTTLSTGTTPSSVNAGLVSALTYGDSRVYATVGSSIVAYTWTLSETPQAQWSTNGVAGSLAFMDGHLYAAFSTAGRIDVFTPAGTLADSWTVGQRAAHVAAGGGHVYVATPVNSGTVTPTVIKQFTPAGVLVDEWTAGGDIQALAYADGHLYVGMWLAATVEVYNVAGSRQATAEMDTATGRFEARSVRLAGTTRADVLAARQLVPVQPDVPDRAFLSAYRLATPQGVNVFSSVAERDKWLPDPPDGTEAYTGEGAELVGWLRRGGEWVADLSEWSPAALSSGYKDGLYPVQVRIEGPRVHIEGRVERTSGNFTTGAEYGIGFVAASLGSDAQKLFPGSTTSFFGAVSSFATPGYARVEVNTAGAITIGVSKTTGWVEIKGSWPLKGAGV